MTKTAKGEVFKPEVLDELLAGMSTPEELMGDAGLFKQLKKALMERVLGAELTHHLGYEKGDPAGQGSGNSRNGHSAKTVLGEDGEIKLAIPRDRAGSFEPQLVPKGVTRLDGFDAKVISLYARGLTVREIQGHLKETAVSRSGCSGRPEVQSGHTCPRKWSGRRRATRADRSKFAKSAGCSLG